MGRLLADLSRKMKHKADSPTADPLRVAVHSTHDTGLAGLCATLDVFDEKYVPAQGRPGQRKKLTWRQVACIYVGGDFRAVHPAKAGAGTAA
jgi:hypothetical protein